MKAAGWGIGGSVLCRAADCVSKVCSFGRCAAANCAMPPTANASQYITLNYKPLVHSSLCRYINDLLPLITLLQAVCCSDKLHCCPNGYTCDLAAGTCDKNSHSVSWNAVYVSHVDKQPSAQIVVCPGGRQFCPDNNTCCMMQSGEYGCCPAPKVR